MAVPQLDRVDEFQRLRSVATRLRLQAIRSQISIGLTFCSVAESQLRSGHAARLEEVIAKLRKLSATVRRHLDEPEHIPPDDVEEVRGELAHLESGILALEERQQSNR